MLKNSKGSCTKTCKHNNCRRHTKQTKKQHKTSKVNRNTKNNKANTNNTAAGTELQTAAGAAKAASTQHKRQLEKTPTKQTNKQQQDTPHN
jgi:hypothetical protein